MTQEEKEINQNQVPPESPNWNWTTKLVFGLMLVAIAVYVLVQFQEFLGPLISAFILAYLIHPIAGFMQRKIKIPWRISVTIIFIILVIVILGLLTWGGFAVFEQGQNLIRFIEKNIDQLPDLVNQLTSQTYQIGPFSFSLAGLNWEEIASQVVGAVQPILGRLGSIAGSIASGAVSVVTWTILILGVSYFLLAETEGIPSRLLSINIPGHSYDLQQMGKELNRIWNAFVRGEILVVLFSLVIYVITLGALGVQFFFGLALIAAIGQLIPYLGAWITWISFGLVALFQSETPFGLQPGIYMVLVLGVSMIMNNVIDSLIRPRVMSSSLKVHPALVLIGALIGLQMFGFVGIIIAAPVMATFDLFINYIIKKLSDQDPWKDMGLEEPVETAKWVTFFKTHFRRLLNWLKQQWRKLRQKVFPVKVNHDEKDTTKRKE